MRAHPHRRHEGWEGETPGQGWGRQPRAGSQLQSHPLFSLCWGESHPPQTSPKPQPEQPEGAGGCSAHGDRSAGAAQSAPEKEGMRATSPRWQCAVAHRGDGQRGREIRAFASRALCSTKHSLITNRAEMVVVRLALVPFLSWRAVPFQTDGQTPVFSLKLSSVSRLSWECVIGRARARGKGWAGNTALTAAPGWGGRSPGDGAAGALPSAGGEHEFPWTPEVSNSFPAQSVGLGQHLQERFCLLGAFRGERPIPDLPHARSLFHGGG